MTPAARNVIAADSVCVSVGGANDSGPTDTRVQGNYLARLVPICWLVMRPEPAW